MTTFVLVHGAWAGGWMWDAVADDLRAGGAEVVAVDLASVGADPSALGTLEDDIGIVRGAVEGAGGPVVLVGHSYGGVPVSAFADHDAVARTVYVAAVWPEDGQTLVEALSAGPPLTWFTPRADGAVELSPDHDLLHRVLLRDLPRDEALGVIARLRLHAASTLMAPALSPTPKHPTTYVVCEEDQAIVRPVQEHLAGRADEVVRMASDHCPMAARHEELAEVLASAASEASPGTRSTVF